MSEPRQVVTSDGHRGVIVGETDPAHDAPGFVEVQMEGGRRLHVPVELLQRRSDGAFDLKIGMADVEGLTARGGSPGTAGAGSAAAPGRRRYVLPVVVEELEVGQRTITTGVVRVEKHVREREEQVAVPLAHEQVHIERVPVGQLVDVAPEVRSRGDTLVIPVVEEVLVVEKRLRLKEEIHLKWSRTVEQAHEQAVLREEEVIVTRQPPDEEEGGY